MRSLPKPNYKAGEVFDTCISRIRDSDLKIRLENCREEIISDSMDFEVKAKLAQLHLINQKKVVNNNVTVKEMEKVYTDRMVGEKAPGRSIYSKLRNPTGDDKCPFCAQRNISTLDHYLPKAFYPSLVVAPVNLVPACKDCNTIKKAAHPTSSNEETLHPYFDNIEKEQWLFAKVLEVVPVSFYFFIKAPINTDQLKFERVKFHFEQYQLNKLYKSQAASELSDISYMMKKLWEKDILLVEQHLKEVSYSCYANNKNSWKTAMYQALANNAWYHSNGAGL